MPLLKHFAIFHLAAAVLITAAPAQQTAAPNIARPDITLNVVVTGKSGPPISGLTAADFTLFDNRAPQPILSLKELTPANSPVSVILLLDGVNMTYSTFANIRYKIRSFLLANNGQLALPTTLASFVDAGTNADFNFTTDGRQISDQLDRVPLGIRPIGTAGGVNGDIQRVEISVNSLQDIVNRAAKLPGRKIIVCISPGWPFVQDPNIIVYLKQKQQIYSNVISLLTSMRLGNITLYSVNPEGAAAGPAYRYHDFVIGLTKPDQAEIGDLALQAFATESGGLVLNSGNDLAGMMRDAVADTQTVYQLTYAAPTPGEPTTLHKIEIKVDKPKTTARTQLYYYAQQ